MTTTEMTATVMSPTLMTATKMTGHAHNLPYSKLTVAAQSDLNWGSKTALYEK